jgi:phenolic acid decarboxylase
MTELPCSASVQINSNLIHCLQNDWVAVYRISANQQQCYPLSTEWLSCRVPHQCKSTAMLSTVFGMIELPCSASVQINSNAIQCLRNDYVAVFRISANQQQCYPLSSEWLSWCVPNQSRSTVMISTVSGMSELPCSASVQINITSNAIHCHRNDWVAVFRISANQQQCYPLSSEWQSCRVPHQCKSTTMLYTVFRMTELPCSASVQIISNSIYCLRND